MSARQRMLDKTGQEVGLLVRGVQLSIYLSNLTFFNLPRPAATATAATATA